MKRLLIALTLLTTTLAPAQNNIPACQCPMPTGPANPNAVFVGYLPLYEGLDWTQVTPTLDFTKMTHLNLGFLNPPRCTPAPCTAHSDMNFSARNLTDAGLDAIVSAAHAHNVKVLASIGGGGGDQMILQFYNAGLSMQLVDSLDKFMQKHHIDGVDLDQESPSNMGQPLTDFVNALAAKFHPQGKLVTAAVAKYLQDSMQDSALRQFDFINVMVYADLQRSLAALNYYVNNKHIPKEKVVLGIGFFGTSTYGNEREADYNKILAAYPNAWQVDLVSGGALDNGRAYAYAGEDTVAKEVALGKQFGGIMVWHILSDAPAPHSLLNVIQKNF